MATLGAGRVAGCLLVILVAATGPAAFAATDSATGSGSARILPFVELVTTDASVAAFSAMPTSADPGPRVHSTSDGLAWNARWTNTRHLVFLDVASATDSGAASTETIQGTVHTIADWIYQRQNAGTHYGTVTTTGTYDANAAAYTAPGGFTKDSQGTVTIRLYPQTAPPDGGATTVVSWIYDATQNQYRFDATDKDFTNGNGEATVFPKSSVGKTAYTFTLSGLFYGVGAVAGAGSNYVPTVQLAWNAVPGVAGGETFTTYTLIDLPSGTPKDTYSFTIRASVSDTK